MPEVLCESFDWNQTTEMRPAIDALWQSSGTSGSPSYTADGKWIEP
jgi:hypothetical protein